MAIVELSDTEWQAVIAIIATAPWRDANPLLMKIGNQLRMQQLPLPQGEPIRTDGKEQHHE